MLAFAILVAGLLTMPPALSAEEGEPNPTPTRPANAEKPAPTATASKDGWPATATPTPEPAPTPVVYPLAVMIDNFPAARPQSGLGLADVVYEALAEGGITRFLAIYTPPDPGLVGPVRSARHYYVYWAAEYNAPIVHILASDEGYAALVNTGLPDLDEHRGDPGFERSADRPMPYNAYTSPAYARQILAANEALWPGSLGGFERQPPPRRMRGVGTGEVEITYPLAGYQVGWTFDRAQRRYLRSQAGQVHVDAATGQPVAASTVVVQFVPTWQHAFRGGEHYVDMELTGAGRAVYFQNGLVVEGAWHKPSLGDYTRYLGPDGSPITFRPGPVWVQIVPSGPLEGSLSYTPLRAQ